jgi:hypothetical protein
MSETTDETTGVQATDKEAEPREASFDEGISRAQRELEKRKVREYELPREEGEDPLLWRFTIKKLTAEERDKVEDAGTEIKEHRNEISVETDSSAIKKELIKQGVVEGPDGFKLTDRHTEKLPYEVRDDLADSIEEFSDLPEEERVAF